MLLVMLMRLVVAVAVAVVAFFDATFLVVGQPSSLFLLSCVDTALSVISSPFLCLLLFHVEKAWMKIKERVNEHMHNVLKHRVFFSLFRGEARP